MEVDAVLSVWLAGSQDARSQVHRKPSRNFEMPDSATAVQENQISLTRSFFQQRHRLHRLSFLGWMALLAM